MRQREGRMNSRFRLCGYVKGMTEPKWGTARAIHQPLPVPSPAATCGHSMSPPRFLRAYLGAYNEQTRMTWGFLVPSLGMILKFVFRQPLGRLKDGK